MHFSKRLHSAFQKVLQHRETRDSRRLPHHGERGLDERPPHVLVETGTDFADEPDLVFARLPVGRTPVGGAVFGDGKESVGARQARDEGLVELL